MLMSKILNIKTSIMKDLFEFVKYQESFFFQFISNFLFCPAIQVFFITSLVFCGFLIFHSYCLKGSSQLDAFSTILPLLT